MRFSPLGQNENEAVDFSTQFRVSLTDKQTKKTHQENRVLYFWFTNAKSNQLVEDTNKFMRLLLQSDRFPRGKTHQQIESTFFRRLFFIYQTIDGINANISSNSSNGIRNSNNK